MGPSRGRLEGLRATLPIPQRMPPSDSMKRYISPDERYQVGRAGRRRHKHLEAPVVAVGHKFAARVGAWGNEGEHRGARLRHLFEFRRLPRNEVDPNAILMASALGGKFLGHFSAELGRILPPFEDEGLLGIF